MIANLDASGKLTVSPETGTEAYALRKWREEDGVLEVIDTVEEPEGKI